MLTDIQLGSLLHVSYKVMENSNFPAVIAAMDVPISFKILASL